MVEERPLIRAGIVREMVQNRAERFRGHFGISIPPAREYNIDLVLGKWRELGIISKFDISKKGQYVVHLDEQHRWLVNCPLELVKLPEAELTRNNFLMICQWCKYFVYDGKIWEIPESLRPAEPENNGAVSLGGAAGAGTGGHGDYSNTELW